MRDSIDFDEILARNPHLNGEVIEQAKALQRALQKERAHAMRPVPERPGSPQATAADDPLRDPRVTRLPLSAQIV